jgi:hypothetical protein
MPCQTIEAMYNFFDFFPAKLSELRKEVETLRESKAKAKKQKCLKPLKTERRKAA